MISNEQLFWNEKFNEEQRHIQIYYSELCYEHARPSFIYKPKLTKDGNQWCALYGDNLQDGVCGFGESPKKAYEDFDRQWNG